MSPADAPETLTPQMRLRLRRRAARMFGAVLILGIALLAGLVLSVNHGRNFERLVRQLGLERYLAQPRDRALSPPTRYRRSAFISPIPSRLIEQTIAEIGGFRQSVFLAAQDRCLDMGREGADTPSLRETADGWECIASFTFGTDPAASALFVQARGASSEIVQTFRAKLSFLAADQDGALIGATLDSIDRFGLDLSPESRRYVEDLLTDKRDASSLLENYRITFERERGDERRFNLIITPLPSTAQCPDPSNGIPGARLQASTIAIPLGCLGVPASSRLSLFGPVQPD